MASRLKEFLRLAVPEYIPPGVFGFLAGYALSAAFIPIPLLKLLAGAVAVTAAIAGYNTYNAINDLEIDRVNKPSRPLPMGTLRVRDAYYATVFFFALALAIGYLIGAAFLAVICVTVVIAILYSAPRINLKGKVGIGVLSAAFLYTVLCPLAGLSIGRAWPGAYLLVAYLFIFGIGTAILKDFEDVAGDSKFGAHTPVMRLGYSSTLYLIALIFVISMLFMLMLAIRGFVSFGYVLASMLALPALIDVYMLYSNRTAKEGGKVFVMGMITLMAIEAVFIMLAFL